MPEHLLLLGHGSHLNPRSSAPIHEQAARLQATGRFASVASAFWKEEPSFARALDRYQAGDVVALPMFVSNGFFTGEVIPAEMGLEGRVTERAGLTVRLAEPVGTHPAVADLVVARAEEAGATRSSVVVVLGHGTLRNPQSERCIYAQAARVKARGLFEKVGVAFLEHAPRIEDVPVMFPARDVVAVPLFIADGWHVDESLPEPMRPAEAPQVRFTPAVGTHPGMGDVVAACAEEAMAW